MDLRWLPPGSLLNPKPKLLRIVRRTFWVTDGVCQIQEREIVRDTAQRRWLWKTGFRLEKEAFYKMNVHVDH